MKKATFFVFIVSALSISCQPTQQVNTYTEGETQTINGMETEERLHDIWVLETLNGTPVNAKQFMKGLPQLELFPKENRFVGSDGCNRIRGTLSVENASIQFSKILSTKMACPGMKNSNLQGMLQQIDHWRREELKLYFLTEGKTVMEWKKVD